MYGCRISEFDLINTLGDKVKWLCNLCDKQFDAVLNRQNDFTDIDMSNVLQIVLAEMENISTVSAAMSHCLKKLSDRNVTLSKKVENIDFRLQKVEKVQTNTKLDIGGKLPTGDMREKLDFSVPPPILRQACKMLLRLLSNHLFLVI